MNGFLSSYEDVRANAPMMWTGLCYAMKITGLTPL
jgi:hypothetical protein